MKIPKDAPEASAMSAVCYGAPNMYFIFANMSLFNLKEEGEVVYIIPQSWPSEAYDILLSVDRRNLANVINDENIGVGKYSATVLTIS